MSLTEREFQQMRELERRLAVEDPSFARRMTYPQTGLVSARRARLPLSGRVGVAAAVYLSFAFLMALAVAGVVGPTALTVFAVIDLIALAALIATGRHAVGLSRQSRLRAVPAVVPAQVRRRPPGRGGL